MTVSHEITKLGAIQWFQDKFGGQGIISERVITSDSLNVAVECVSRLPVLRKVQIVLHEILA
jgi:hypothetical protein